MTSWTQNTNLMINGYTPIQLVIGKSITFLRIIDRNEATEFLYEDEEVRIMMERHQEMVKNYNEQMFCKNIERSWHWT